MVSFENGAGVNKMTNMTYAKVLLDGLHDPNSNLSSLRGTERVIMRKIWHACSGINKLVNTWEDFHADPSPPADETPSSGVSKGTQTVKLFAIREEEENVGSPYPTPSYIS